MNDRSHGLPGPKVSLRLLGAVGVDAPGRADAEQLPAQPKRLALLAWLATALPRGPWRRDALLPVFWPALDEGRARSALRQTVFHLREALPAGALPSLGTQDVRLDIALVGSDVGDFEQLLDVGREEDALALYHGDLLPGFQLSGCPEFERWLDRERERLRRRASRAAWFLAERAAERDVERHTDEDPSHLVRRAIELAPFDEAGIRRGMQMLAAAGNLGFALEVFEAYRRDLEHDHGVPPASETLALFASLRGDGAPAPPEPSDAGSPDRVPASVAVLPFSDLSPARDLEWFGAGLAEEIIDRLVQAGGVQVCARTSSFVAPGGPNGEPVDVRALGRRLGVDAILEGSVRADGERFRVTAQLIRVDDGFHLWSTRFDPESSDLFAVQDEIAIGVTRRLLGDVPAATDAGASSAADAGASSAAGAELSPRSAIPTDAYREYLRGRYQLVRRTPASLERAVTHLERAIAEAPEFGPAHAALAECYAILPVYTAFPSAHAMPLARAAADRALALDDSLAQALGARAYAGLVYDWDWTGAEQSWLRALELDPGAARLRATCALYPLTCTGRHALAIEQVERARSDDPLALPVIAYAGYVHLFARDYATAADRAREAVEQDDEFVLGHWVLGSTLQCMGDHEAALAEYARAVELTRASALMRLQLACGLAGAGDRAGAERILDEMGEAAGAAATEAPPYFRAMVLTALGRADEALEHLRRAYRERAVHLVFLNVEPRFDPLRGDRRFRELVLRIGLRPSASVAEAARRTSATAARESS
jgi:TolB-like protein